MALAKHNHTPAKINRRSLLGAAPVAGLVAMTGYAGPVEAASETPIMVLFRKWMRLDQEEQDIGDLEDLLDNDPRFDVVTSAKYAVLEKMRAEPRRDINDLALCILADTEFGLYGTAGNKWREARDQARAIVGA